MKVKVTGVIMRTRRVSTSVDPRVGTVPKRDVGMQTLMYESSINPRRPHNTRHETQPHNNEVGLVSPWKLDHTGGSRQDINTTRVPITMGNLWMARFPPRRLKNPLRVLKQ